MKTKIFTISFVVAMSLLMLSCTKDRTPQNQEKPTSFLDLKISPSFKFENFDNVQTSIQLANNKAAGVEIIQIYDAHPNQGGKLILTGAADQNGTFNLPIRIASRLTEVYVAKLSSLGANEYVAVPVKGNSIQVNFGTTEKTVTSIDPWCDCDANQTLPDGFNGDLELENGETRCVAPNTTVTIKKFKLHEGGALKICGNVTIQKFYGNFSGGDITVSPSGNVIVQQGGLPHSLENYGVLTFSSKDVDIVGSLVNYGTVSSSKKITVHGTFENNGSFSTTYDFIINENGTVTNNCEMLINNKEFDQQGTFTNNGYVYVDKKMTFEGQTTLGSGSLIDTKDFEIKHANGNYVNGVNTSNPPTAQIKATDEGQVKNNAVVSNVDLCANNADYANNADFTNVTTCEITVPIPQCDANVAPEITSSLQIGGVVGQAITPYVITATGTEPIDFNASNLPAGLTYNDNTHTISGTPTAAGTYNVDLSASNMMGQDNKTLVIIVTQPTAAPVITSSLTAQATVDQAFSYTLTASGQGPITYNVANLPAGLTFDPETQKITGSTEAAGTYNITLAATNAGGTTTETLVLTVGTPPTITSPLTASGTAGDQFVTYTVTGTGSPTITYNATNLPQGLTFNPANNTINGTPLYPGVYEVTLTANNSYGTDVQTLVITIAEGLQAPEITSSLTANGVQDFPFSYTITATGSQPMTYNATDLPAGLTISGNTISGIPTVSGTFNIPLTATNAAGEDNKTLVLTIVAGSGDDSDGDGIPDNLDEYPDDNTRAFNSYYPNEVDFVSVAFEDLWPGYGDYDFNDFVVNLNYKMVTNANNEYVDVIIQYQIMADGASLDNGFGLVFNTSPDNVESVTGCIKLGNAVMIDPKGFEAGHTNETVIIPIDNINPIMDGGMANTIPGGKYVQTTVNTVTTHFSNPQASIGTPPYNPFIFVDQVRGHEVHLKDNVPTEFVDEELFGTYSDASDPGSGLYYRSTNGLPWGIETPINFNYPIENADILTAHLKFADWAQSAGVDFQDWYMDKPGYRNDENIYVIPQ